MISELLDVSASTIKDAWPEWMYIFPSTEGDQMKDYGYRLMLILWITFPGKCTESYELLLSKPYLMFGHPGTTLRLILNTGPNSTYRFLQLWVTYFDNKRQFPQLVWMQQLVDVLRTFDLKAAQQSILF